MVDSFEAFIPRDYTASRMRILRMTALRLGLTPECQPIAQSDQTYADHGDPRLTATGYLLTCQTCGSELTTDQPGRLAHQDDGTHEHQPD